MRKIAIFFLLLIMMLLPAVSLCEAAPEPAEAEVVTEPALSPLFADTAIPAFALTSPDLTDGVWNPVIAKSGGENLSPQLFWEPVPEAACYVVYMVDTSVMDFVHWMSNNVAETELPQGWAAAATEYVGPYPPPGETHTYDVYVLALRQPVENLKCSLNAANVFFARNVMYLDAPAESVTGNLLGYGYLSGTFTGSK